MALDASPRNAAHLLRRLAWGGDPDAIARVVGEGIEASVDRLLDPGSAPTVVEPFREIGEYPYGRDMLVQSFMHLASTSPTPAIERLMWFWHGHFATSLAKVQHADLMFRQFATLRSQGLGRFDDLLLSMIHDTAMNLWLDLSESKVGQPNENFARELLELFTMGIDSGYTQLDVVGASRALTGLSVRDHPLLGRPMETELVPARHDFGTKSFLGATGNLDVSDVVDRITSDQRCHRFIASRFWHRYAGTAPPGPVIDDLAAAFGARLEIRDLLRALATHPRFYEPDVRGGLIAQPVEVLVRVARGFGFDVTDPSRGSFADLERQAEADETLWPFVWVNWADRMGQLPGYPPNVGGWPHNEPWLDSNRAAGRLLVGVDIGREISWAQNDICERLRQLAWDRMDLVEAILSRFGVVEWSDETAAAIRAAAADENREHALASAVTVAFTSPEVTLA